MECGTCIEALSARMDGEPEPVPAGETDAHLRECAECRAWQAGAVALTRTLRVREYTPTPDLTAAVLAEVKPRRGQFARIALAAVGLLQLLLAVAQLFGEQIVAEHSHGGAETITAHLVNEGAAWNLALGLAMLAAAWQPRRAIGLLPAVGAFVAALAVVSVMDLFAQGVPASRLLSHLPLLLGLALLFLVQRQERANRDPAPTAGDSTDSVDWAVESGDEDRRAGPYPPWLRPAGKRAA